jgi:hypothetical protein
MGTSTRFFFVPNPIPAELIGQRFGLLTVVADASAGHRYQMARCQCDCGKVTVVRKSRLFERLGRQLGCGCLRGRHTKHSDCHSKLYRVWDAMVRRCHNPNHRAFASYGGRGIWVCEEWRDYRNFKAWADSSGYAQGLTIDRIDNDNGYAPGNCRWATRKQQQNNRRCCVYVEHDGQRLTLTEWSEAFGVPRQSVRKHLEAMNGGQ